MRIAEIIIQLKQIHRQYGDVYVYVNDGAIPSRVMSVGIQETLTKHKIKVPMILLES